MIFIKAYIFNHLWSQPRCSPVCTLSIWFIHQTHCGQLLGFWQLFLKNYKQPPPPPHPTQQQQKWCGNIVQKSKILRVKMSAYYKINNFNFVIWSNCFEGYSLSASNPPSKCMCKHSKALAFYLPLRLNLWVKKKQNWRLGTLKMEIYKFDIRIVILSISSTFLCVYFNLNMLISIIYAVIYKDNCSKNVVS